MPNDARLEPLDGDLSTVQPAVDKVFRFQPPHRGLLHLEAQASWDGGFADRLLLYSVLLEHHYGGPVHTVVLLLRREAAAPSLTGLLSRRHADGREYHRFAYEMIRVWDLSAEQLLASGLGAAVLALLTDEASPRLPEYVKRFAERVERESPNRNTEDMLLTSSFARIAVR